ncbi:MAG: hypothetical protein LBU66_06220 [Treponema sp.]|jgi:hypothetical protein|nr:hypothetical protein [Treponema sp.]
MKRFYIFTILFFMAGWIFHVNAQDLIFLRDGRVIEAKVTEISPTQIMFRNYGNEEGQVTAISAAGVLSIRYENGLVEIINPDSLTSSIASPIEQAPAQPPKPKTAMNPDRLTFGLSTELSGWLLFGPSIQAEFTKGRFNAQLSVRAPTLGLLSLYVPYADDGPTYSIDEQMTSSIGFGAAINYFRHSRVGGFFIGVLAEVVNTRFEAYHSWYDDNYEKKEDYNKYSLDSFVLAINIGYKFVTPSSIYFRTGLNLGVLFWETLSSFNGIYKPESYFVPYFHTDLAIGFNF